MKSKLLVAAVAAFIFSPLALANGYMPQPVTSPFDGPYLGLGAGVVHNVANAEANYSWEHPTVFNNGELPTKTGVISADSDKGMNTVGGTAFAGWGHTFGANKTWYLAGELYVRYSPAYGKYTSYTRSETEHYPNAYSITYGHNFKYGKYRTDWFYGAQAKGGYLICPHTLLYLSIGAETTKFHVYRTEHSFWATSNIPGYHSFTHTIYGKSFNRWRWAPVPGVGFMTVIHHNWILGGQYTYAFYGPFSTTTTGSFEVDHHIGNGAAPSEPVTVNYTHKTKIKNVDVSQFMLTLAYRFDV